MFGEVSPGGTGSGLYGMLVFALLAVFIAGLMVGRTPEYLGKKIQAAEMKLVVLYILFVPLVILTRDRRLMGDQTNRWFTTLAAALAAVFLIVLNGLLLWLTFAP